MLPSPSVRLQPTTAEDLDFVLTMEQAPENAPFIGQWSRDRHLQACQSRDECHLTVINAATEEPIGYAILSGMQNPSSCVLIKRIVIAPKGKGFGRATIEQILHKAFLEFKAHRVWLDVMEDNPRAKSLYQKLGFVEEGKMREAMKKPRGFVSLWIMSMLRSEFIAKGTHHRLAPASKVPPE